MLLYMLSESSWIQLFWKRTKSTGYVRLKSQLSLGQTQWTGSQKWEPAFNSRVSTPITWTTQLSSDSSLQPAQEQLPYVCVRDKQHCCYTYIGTTPRTEGWKEELLLPPQGEPTSLINHSTWKKPSQRRHYARHIGRQPSKKMLSCTTQPFIAILTDQESQGIFAALLLLTNIATLRDDL